SLGPRSMMRLRGVHPDLVKVVQQAIKLSTVDFTVLEGLRSIERQRTLVDSGASQTLNSRHLTGHAVDLGAWVDNQVDWSWPLYAQINAAMQQASKQSGVLIIWGGGWKTFKDGPHFELPRKEYP
ncbi:MAG: M15 family metallopeptidase, partial [Limnohabitans sp.]